MTEDDRDDENDKSIDEDKLKQPDEDDDCSGGDPAGLLSVAEVIPPAVMRMLPQEVLASLPSEMLASMARSVSVHQSFKGPLPPPPILKAYDALLPGTADRIIKLAEREQEHRHIKSMSTVNGQREDKRRGSWFGFLVCFGCLGIAALAIIYGSSLTGVAMIIAMTAVLGGTFLGARVLRGIQTKNTLQAISTIIQAVSDVRKTLPDLDTDGDEDDDPKP
ncbi:MAG: hypothetical protein AUK47_26410 [Deltaproteobacteria bacterium CG2_30_63_29]|nr:MAG: hypothetical protein AUK47_26410 [Deltaproteobacteria bacterium CG2_30_63_29]PJB48885.1 MAG: hypothetical protein CO108_01410 [Deltaproteobacteria bacterium CG_4_9_14_3_um_filter_63_12]